MLDEATKTALGSTVKDFEALFSDRRSQRFLAAVSRQLEYDGVVIQPRSKDSYGSSREIEAEREREARIRGQQHAENELRQWDKDYSEKPSLDPVDYFPTTPERFVLHIVHETKQATGEVKFETTAFKALEDYKNCEKHPAYKWGCLAALLIELGSIVIPLARAHAGVDKKV